MFWSGTLGILLWTLGAVGVFDRLEFVHRLFGYGSPPHEPSRSDVSAQKQKKPSRHGRSQA